MTYNSIKRKVFYECYRIGVEHISEDISQEVLIRRITGPTKKQTIKQCVIDVLRESSGRKGCPTYNQKIALTNTLELDTDRDTSRDELSNDRDTVLDCRRIIDGVTNPKMKQLLWSYYVDGYTHEEIAENNKISYSRVSQLLSEYASRLRKLYNKDISVYHEP